MYIVLDVEATDEQEIIEIGAVKLNDRLEIIDNFQSFVKPTQNSFLTHYIKKLTGIQQCEIDSAKHFPIVFEEFRDWFGEKPVFITWSMSDKLYFRGEFLYHELQNELLHHFVDIQNIVCDLISSETVVKLKKALTFFEIEFDGDEHRALNDAINTAKLFVVAMTRTNGIDHLKHLELSHLRTNKISPQVAATIPEVLISHRRYYNYLEMLTLPELESKQKMLFLLVKNAENTIRPNYLMQISWQKFKMLCELVTLKKKEQALEEEGLTLIQLSSLLKCSNAIYSLRHNLLTRESEAAKDHHSILKKKIEVNYKHVTRLHKFENLRVTKSSVIQSYEWMTDMLEKLSNSPYFKKKYEKQLSELAFKVTCELERVKLPEPN